MIGGGTSISIPKPFGRTSGFARARPWSMSARARGISPSLRRGLLKSVARVLKPEGRLVVLDWAPDALEPPDLPRRQRYASATVSYMLKKAGFEVCTVSEPNDTNDMVIARTAQS
jgi:SAM-dependent methyltransferase